MEADFADRLRERIAAFQSADTEQNVGPQSQAGATGGFDSLLSEAMSVVRQLDAFAHNFSPNNAARRSEWRVVSHIERAASKKKATAAPAPKTMGRNRRNAVG